jgi:hypothetical protein
VLAFAYATVSFVGIFQLPRFWNHLDLPVFPSIFALTCTMGSNASHWNHVHLFDPDGDQIKQPSLRRIEPRPRGNVAISIDSSSSIGCSHTHSGGYSELDIESVTCNVLRCEQVQFCSSYHVSSSLQVPLPKNIAYLTHSAVRSFRASRLRNMMLI